MKKIFTLLSLLITVLLLTSSVNMIEALEFEDSYPYISLEVEKEEVSPGETFQYIISYGNRGLETAKNVKITLNQAMDGRAPVLFLTSTPEPTDWFSSEYGNLAQFLIPSLDPDDVATQEGEIKITSKVRESVAPQTLSATVSLEASKREIGKRLIVSNTVITHIKTPAAGELEFQTATQEASPTTELLEEALLTSPTPSPAEESQANLTAKILSSEALGAVAVFLGGTALIIIAFVAGRKSKAR